MWDSNPVRKEKDSAYLAAKELPGGPWKAEGVYVFGPTGVLVATMKTPQDASALCTVVNWAVPAVGADNTGTGHW